MRASEIVQLKRELNNAIDAAGRGEWRGFILLEKLDELGFDLTRRSPPSPDAIVAAVEACAAIAEVVEAHKPNGLTPEDDRLFRD